MLINEDLEKYASYLTNKKNCIVCGTSSDKAWAQYGSYSAVQCPSCSFVWIDPCLNNEGLNLYYNDYIGMRFKDEEKTRQRAIQYKIDRGFLEIFISSGKVLDVGCSGGFFLNEISDKFEKHGIEVDGQAVEYARAKYPFGKNVVQGALENAQYSSGSFDLLIMRGVIEHLPAPRLTIPKATELLKQGGYFYIAATPNVESFCADIYREHWNQFHPIRHVSYFSERTLSMFLGNYGLKLVAKDFPYLETPYADVEKDHLEMLKAYQARKEGTFDKMGRSRAFWGNMMNLVYCKV